MSQKFLVPPVDVVKQASFPSLSPISAWNDVEHVKAISPGDENDHHVNDFSDKETARLTAYVNWTGLEGFAYESYQVIFFFLNYVVGRVGGGRYLVLLGL